MKIKDEKLFLKYSLPCSKTLLNRGFVSEDKIKELMTYVKRGKKTKIDPRKVFLVAVSNCTLIAKRMKKKIIDNEVIRKYFLAEHDRTVDRRFEEMGDFDPMECRVYPGKVLSVGKIAHVITPRGSGAYRKDFVRVKSGDYVVVHYEFIVEKIPLKLAKDLWEGKQKYIKNFIKFR